MDSVLSALAIGVSLVLFAIAALGGASIASVRREQVQRLVSEGVPGSLPLERLHYLPSGPTGSLTLLKGLSFSAALVSGAVLAITLAGERWALVGILGLALLISLGLIEAVATRLGLAAGERMAIRIAGPVRALAWLLNPILAAQAGLTRRGAVQGDSSADVGPAEISLPIDAGGDHLDEREVRMIRAVVRQDQTIAREIMVPRVDIVAAEIGKPIAELADLMVAGGHSRVPVYRADVDHIEGIAYARDILRHLVSDPEKSSLRVESMVRPALFIPESKTLEELLNEFQQRRVHMAIVVDEYGGVSGLVTIEDLLEEIVGEIQDEFDVGESEIIPVNSDEFVMDARVSIDQLNELLSVSVEADGFDTLGGFVYRRLGKIPSSGDSVEYDGVKIEVISTAGRRLKRLRVTRSRAED